MDGWACTRRLEKQALGRRADEKYSAQVQVARSKSRLAVASMTSQS